MTQSGRNEIVKILIIEDSPTQAEQLRYTLEQHGYDVAVARNGVEGLAMARRQSPALVISDINMPEMSGYDFCRSVRRDPKLAGLPVILLTSLSEAEDVLHGLECGADNFVTKPFEEEYLISRIRYITANQHLRSSESTNLSLEVQLGGRKHLITADRLQILHLLLSTYETAVLRNKQLLAAQEELRRLNETLEEKVQARTAELTREMAERARADADRARLLRERESLLESTSEGIFGLDTEGQCTFINRAGAAMLGADPATLAGLSVEALTGADPSDEHGAAVAIRPAYENGERCHSDSIHFAQKDGTRFPVDLTANPILQDGRITGAVVTFRDITEKKRLEAELLRIQRLETIGALAGGVAHDLNNVLAPIIMGLDLVERDAQSAKSLITCMRSSAARGSAIVRQILSFARGAEEETGALHVDQLIRDQVEVCRNTFPRKITIEDNLPETLWPAISDRTGIFQILMNLCVNARDAMASGGRLTLSAENVRVDESMARMTPDAAPGPYVKIQISDTGPGIPPEIIRKITEPFFTTKPAGTGTGLGLSTVATIVRSHRGFLTIESELGRGATFSVYLPAAVDLDPVATAVEESAPPRGNGELILVADDEKTLLQIIKGNLELHGYRVLDAADGSEAVLLMAKHQSNVAAVVADEEMPLLDGPSTLRVARRMHPRIRALLMSGRVDSKHAPDLNDLPDVAVLAKPFNTDRLLHALHKLLQEPLATDKPVS